MLRLWCGRTLGSCMSTKGNRWGIASKAEGRKSWRSEDRWSKDRWGGKGRVWDDEGADWRGQQDAQITHNSLDFIFQFLFGIKQRWRQPKWNAVTPSGSAQFPEGLQAWAHWRWFGSRSHWQWGHSCVASIKRRRGHPQVERSFCHFGRWQVHSAAHVPRWLHDHLGSEHWADCAYGFFDRCPRLCGVVVEGSSSSPTSNPRSFTSWRLWRLSTDSKEDGIGANLWDRRLQQRRLIESPRHRRRTWMDEKASTSSPSFVSSSWLAPKEACGPAGRMGIFAFESTSATNVENWGICTALVLWRGLRSYTSAIYEVSRQ